MTVIAITYRLETFQPLILFEDTAVFGRVRSVYVCTKYTTEKRHGDAPPKTQCLSNQAQVFGMELSMFWDKSADEVVGMVKPVHFFHLHMVFP